MANSHDTSARLIKLEQELALSKKRMEFLEEALVKLQREQRAETMHHLGAAFLQMGEKLINVANSEKNFKVIPVGGDEQANDQTFFANRTESGWEFQTMQKGTLITFDFTMVVPNMQRAVMEFLGALPADEVSVSFNVYRS